MTRPQRSGSDSRCCNRQHGPYMWRYYLDETNRSVEELEAWLGTLTRFARAHEEGAIQELFEAAARGVLQDSGDEVTKIKPVRTDPEIYELRRTALSKKLRFYHGEPAELPMGLVALHKHIKSDSPGQQAEIDFATDRYRVGRPTAWL